MTKTTKLSLIEGGGSLDDFGLLPASEAGGSAPLDSSLGRPMLRRPGDHLESVVIETGTELEGVRAAARARDLHPDTALALVIERRLMVSQLVAYSDPSLVGRLDRSALRQRPQIELWSAHSAYLTHLLHGCEQSDTEAGLRSDRLALPIRILDRVGAGIPVPLEAPEAELDHSIAWEVAALLNGETMGEWAYRSALSSVLSRTLA